jgi:GNAT superfamily N-acetyltransferase
MPFHRLPQGTEVWLRPIRPTDKPGIAGVLGRMSLETIHRRYLATKTRFSPAELRYLTEVDGVDHYAVVAVDAATGDIEAVCRYVRLPDDPETAEWAIVIADRLQHQGLGKILMEHLAGVAREHGIRNFTATMLADNRDAARLLLHVAPILSRSETQYGVRTVTAALAA